MKSLFGRLMSSYVVLTFVTLLVVGVAFSYFLQQFFIQQKTDLFLRQGQKLATLAITSPPMGAMGPMGPGGSQRLLQIASQFIEGQAWILDPRGLVLATTLEENSELKLEPSEAQEVLKGNSVVKTGRLDSFPQPVLSVTVPIQSGQNVLGAIRLVAPISEITATARSIRLLVIYAALIAIALAAVLGLTLSRSLTRPMREMALAASALAHGNLSRRVDVTRRDDEVGQLALSFNHMAEQLEATLNQLSQEKQRVDSIVGSMAEGVIAISTDGRIISVNPQAKTLLMTADPEQAVGRPLEDVVDVGVSELMDQVLAEGSLHTVELRRQGRVYLAHVAPIKDQSERLAGAVGVFQDISERWKLEQMQKEFVANVSHEFRTPLTSIQGYVEAIRDGVVSSPDSVHKYLGVVLSESQRLNRLVGDLLQLARLEAGDIDLKTRAVTASGAMDTAIEALRPQAQEKDVALSKEAKPDLPEVKADPDRLQQVLVNLVGNGIRHAPGGKVTIACTCRESDLVFSVTDTGAGIPPEEQHLVWERFYKSDKARTTNKSGTGLGLAIVKQIVELHGGEVWVESQKGHGTSFLFSLPRFIPESSADIQ